MPAVRMGRKLIWIRAPELEAAGRAMDAAVQILGDLARHAGCYELEDGGAEAMVLVRRGDSSRVEAALKAARRALRGRGQAHAGDLFNSQPQAEA